MLEIKVNASCVNVSSHCLCLKPPLYTSVSDENNSYQRVWWFTILYSSINITYSHQISTVLLFVITRHRLPREQVKNRLYMSITLIYASLHMLPILDRKVKWTHNALKMIPKIKHFALWQGLYELVFFSYAVHLNQPILHLSPTHQMQAVSQSLYFDINTFYCPFIGAETPLKKRQNK